MYDYIVIGKGLIGVSTAYFLSQKSDNVVLIGPNEPANFAAHDGVFSSHYDSGRITRELDPDPIWAMVAKRAIAHYADIEQHSGIQFHFRSGNVRAGLPASDGSIKRSLAVAEQLGIPLEQFDSDEFHAAYPMLRFPDGYACLMEKGVAGYIDPRRMIAAQLKLLRRKGGRFVPQEVIRIDTKSNSVDVYAQNGDVLSARRVIIATGAYTNQLLAQKIRLDRKPRTIVKAHIEGAELARLAGMPATIFNTSQFSEDLEGIYSVPPTLYPNGEHYLKIGGEMREIEIEVNDESLQHWFKTGGDANEKAALIEILEGMVPGLNASAYLSKPCVINYTHHNYPYIDTIIDHRLYIATGGCGMAAKSAIEYGRMAALLAYHNEWVYDLDAGNFKAVFAE